MSIEDTHHDVAAIVGSGVGIGVSFEFFAEIIKRAVDKTEAMKLNIPVPMQLPKDELVIRLEKIQIPKVVRNGKAELALEAPKVTLSFRIVNASSGVDKLLREYDVSFDRIVARILTTGDLEICRWTTTSTNDLDINRQIARRPTTS